MYYSWCDLEFVLLLLIQQNILENVNTVWRNMSSLNSCEANWDTRNRERIVDNDVCWSNLGFLPVQT